MPVICRASWQALALALALACSGGGSAGPDHDGPLPPKVDSGRPTDAAGSPVADVAGATEAGLPDAAEDRLVPTADTLGDPDAPRDAAVPEAGDDGPRCNDLTLPNQSVELLRFNRNAPFALGGMITDGTYVLTASSEYYGPGGPPNPGTGFSNAGTLSIAGPAFSHLFWEGFGNRTSRSRGTLMVTGAKITLVYECPSGTMSESGEYTVQNGTLTLYLPGAGAKRALVYTRR